MRKEDASDLSGVTDEIQLFAYPAVDKVAANIHLCPLPSVESCQFAAEGTLDSEVIHWHDPYAACDNQNNQEMLSI